MPRKRLSTRDRVRIFDAADGVCHICGEPIEAGQEWEVSHPIPLAAGGEDDDDNRAPAHKKGCHDRQTAEIDLPLIAKVRRVRAVHIGAKAPSRRPMAGSRASGWKRPMDPRKPAERR